MQQQDFVTFLKEANLTAAQIAGGAEIPKAEVVVKWTFELGRSLPTIPSGGPQHLCGRLVGSVSILLSLRIVLHDLNILIP